MANCHCFCTSYNVEIKNEVISIKDMNQTYLIFLFPFLLQMFSYFLKIITVKSYHELSLPYPCPAGKQSSQPSLGSASAGLPAGKQSSQPCQGSASAGLTSKLTPTADNVEKAHAETVVTPVQQDVIDKAESIENIAHGAAETKSKEFPMFTLHDGVYMFNDSSVCADERDKSTRILTDGVNIYEESIRSEGENARQRRRKRRKHIKTKATQLHVVSDPVPPWFSFAPTTASLSISPVPENTFVPQHLRKPRPRLGYLPPHLRTQQQKLDALSCNRNYVPTHLRKTPPKLDVPSYNRNHDPKNWPPIFNYQKSNDSGYEKTSHEEGYFSKSNTGCSYSSSGSGCSSHGSYIDGYSSFDSN